MFHNLIYHLRSTITTFRRLNKKRIITTAVKPNERIDKLIADLSDWRGKTFADIREIICQADPEIVEEWKWMGTPVWSHDGIVCIANAFKDKVKLTFYEGASIKDPEKLFNNGLEGNRWRTIDYFKGDKVGEQKLKDLVCSAVAYNIAKKSAK